VGGVFSALIYFFRPQRVDTLEPKLAKLLTIPDLISIGVGSTVGAGMIGSHFLPLSTLLSQLSHSSPLL